MQAPQTTNVESNCNSAILSKDFEFGKLLHSPNQVDQCLLKVSSGVFSSGEQEGLTFKCDQAMTLINTYGDFFFSDINHMQTNLVD